MCLLMDKYVCFHVYEMRLVAPEDHIRIKMTEILINLLSNMFIRSVDHFINSTQEHAVDQ